jgi:hypothetical protein
MDRLIMMRMDVERYENETIPELHHQLALARQALLEYGCHKPFCAATQPKGELHIGLEAALEGDSAQERVELRSTRQSGMTTPLLLISTSKVNGEPQPSIRRGEAELGA